MTVETLCQRCPPGQPLATGGNGALETCYVPLRNSFEFCLILINSHLNLNSHRWLVAILLYKCRYELWSQTVLGSNPDTVITCSRTLRTYFISLKLNFSTGKKIYK